MWYRFTHDTPILRSKSTRNAKPEITLISLLLSIEGLKRLLKQIVATEPCTSLFQDFLLPEWDSCVCRKWGTKLVNPLNIPFR